MSKSIAGRHSGRRFPALWFPALWRDRRGATAVEFALLFAPFFLMLFGSLELTNYFAVSASLDDAAAEAAREIRTDQPSARNDPNYVRTLICDHFTLVGDCNKLSVSVQVFSTFSAAQAPSVASILAAQPANGGAPALPFASSNPNDIVLMSAVYEFSFLTPLIGQYLSNVGGQKRFVVSSVAFRNEP